MSRTAKIGALLASVLVVLLFGGWSYVYASSGRAANQDPAPDQAIRTTQPKITASLPSVAGVRISSAKVFVDGVSIPARIDGPNNSVLALPPAVLQEGEHLVEARIKYAVFLIPKRTTLRWSFTVDTTAPVLEANDGRPLFAVAEDSGVLAGYTEPGAAVSLTSTGVTGQVEEAENGTFRAALRDIDASESVTVISTDSAGNSTQKDVRVVRDNVPPSVRAVSPKNGDRLYGKYLLKAKIIEKDSYLRTVRVVIDGRWVSAKLKGRSLVTPELSGLKDGPHVAEIVAEDAVGHRTVRTVNFRTDSRHIVVSRAARKLYLYKGGSIWKTYPVAVGRPAYPTPRGDWQIMLKRYRPTWVNPREGWSSGMPASIPPGRGNPLGTRALNLDASGIRIHGTYASGSIGTAASHGCIRMFLSDVEELFELVGVGTPVKIV